MNNQAFSKIWVVIILVVLVVGGILGWQYLKKIEVKPLEGVKPPEEVKPPETEEKEISTEAVDKFMDLRIKGRSELYSYFPGSANVIDLTLGKVLTSFSRILLIAPDLKKYEVVKAKEIKPGKSQFAIKTYLGKEKHLGYYEEKITIEKIRGKSFITSFKQGEYTALTEEDPCKDVDKKRTHIGAVPLTNKDLCYWRAAMEEKDSNACGKIETQVAKDFCYIELAVVKDDLGLCSQVSSEIYTKEGCEKKVNFWRTREELNKQYEPYQPEPIEKWKTYRNEKYGFELKYPQGSAIKEEEGLVKIDFPFTSKTKLKEKYLTIGEESSAPWFSKSEEVMINGINFEKGISGDCAMKTCYDYETYHAIRDEKPLYLDFILHYTTVNSPEFRDAWELMDFDKDQESVIFDQVLSTFEFID